MNVLRQEMQTDNIVQREIASCFEKDIASKVDSTLDASVLRQPIGSVNFKINVSDWLSQDTCDRFATNVEQP